MEPPTTRLFHLHYNVPDVTRAERALANHGIPLRQRFGQVRGEAVALDPGESEPEGFRLRLQTHQRGYANVTLAPGRKLRFDHLGLCTAEFDATLDRAKERGWSVRDPGGRRPFVMTPWGFRVELHRDGSDVESSLGDWHEAHLSAVELHVPNPDEVRDGLGEVFGDVPGLSVQSDGSVQPDGDVPGPRAQSESDGDGRAFVPRFELGGDAFDGREREIEAAALNPD